MHIRAAVLLLSTSVHVSAQTLYDVSQSLAPTGPTAILAVPFSISPVGVGADGGTTYVEIDVESALLDVEPSATLTLLSVPTTLTNTYVVDASGLRFSYAMSEFLGSSVTLAETCSFGANGLGTCVLDGPVGGSATASTFSGSVVPFYTLAAATPAPTTGPSNTTGPSSTPTSQNGAAPHQFFARWSMAWLLLVVCS
ncbi:hypothetical protein C8R44DRAFT_787850 [Mycena epipterygia]|nr:hypothetical protein C8R44DRAFT_787850 [Mycena epipterygia]